MVKKFILFVAIIFLIALASCFGQSVERSIVCPLGQTDKTESITIEWTLGDFSTGDSQSVGQGFNNYSKVISTPVLKVEDIADGIKCFPNPVQDILTLSTDGVYSVTVVDMFGKVLKNINTEFENSIDMSVFQSGFYIIVFKNQKTKKALKIIKN